MDVRSALVLVALALSACAAAPRSETARPAPRLLPEIQRQRLNRVHADAPEVAEAVVRLDRLARDHAARGDHETAQELAALAQLTLLSASELLVRLEAAEAEAARPAEEEEPPPEPEPDPEPPPRRRTRVASASPTPPPEPAPTAPTEDAPESPLTARLAALAAAIASLEPEGEHRVVVEGVQTRLIEADRALAEGTPGHAAELVREAEALLAPITGEPPPPDAEAHAFARDARARLGERARVQGRSVAVRLDDALRFEERSWRGRGDTLDDLRGLVRGYRHAAVSLATVGTPGAGFAERDGLTRFLASRFQIPAERLRWRERPPVSLPAGTWIVVTEAAE
ncbi:MAG: hypothetical protein VYE22_18270 [Myxococcota bacterium]|nr:hypothetical protein [Myxococcota bacterium]